MARSVNAETTEHVKSREGLGAKAYPDPGSRDQKLVTTMACEAIRNGEQWENKREDGELEDWISSLALSRTGIFGPADIALNAMMCLQYERDLANLFVRPGVSYVLSNGANIMCGLGLTGRNSPNTDTAEREALKSLYRLTLSPMSAAFITMLDAAGPIGTAGKYARLTYFSSNSATSGFADIFLRPEKEDERHGPGRRLPGPCGESPCSGMQRRCKPALPANTRRKHFHQQFQWFDGAAGQD
ncbi:MAG: hypothetical protein Devi2KO_38400 [Devosia indica]